MENIINKNMIKKDIKTIIKEVNFINNCYKENIKTVDFNYIINPKDIKLFQFFFKYLLESHKSKDIHILLNSKIKI